MDKLVILMRMIFCHIVDDYYLQGWLASAKQREWWKKNSPNPLYKNDYIVALLMHSFSWAFMIMLPILVCGISSGIWDFYIAYLLINCTLHAIVDDLKANQLAINLVQDQIIHLIQILFTWLMWITI